MWNWVLGFFCLAAAVGILWLGTRRNVARGLGTDILVGELLGWLFG
jgi:hypothetical protein